MDAKVGSMVLFKPYWGNCVCVWITLMKMGELVRIKLVPIKSLVYNNKLQFT